MWKRRTFSHSSHRKWVDRSRHFDLIAFYKKKKVLTFCFLSFLFCIFFYTEENCLFCVFNLHVSTGWAVYIMWGRENSSYTELLVRVTKGMGWGWFPCHPDHETAEYICLSETLVKLREAKAHQTWAQAGAWVCAVWTSDRSGATHPQYLWWELSPLSSGDRDAVHTPQRCVYSANSRPGPGRLGQQTLSCPFLWRWQLTPD